MIDIMKDKRLSTAPMIDCVYILKYELKINTLGCI